MTSVVSTTRPEIELPRGQSETFTQEGSSSTPSTLRANTIKVPSCRPTPLIGSWADESFPLNSRQASEIVAEQVLQKQCSSTLFEDADGNVLLCPSEGPSNNTQINYDVIGANNNHVHDETDDSDCPDDQESMVNESLMQEAMSHAQISHESVGCHHTTVYSGSSSCDDLESSVHVAQAYRYDPYHISDSKTVIARCSCDVCVPMLQQKAIQEKLLQQLTKPIEENESASNQVTPNADLSHPATTASPATGATKPGKFAFMAAPAVEVQDDENDWDLPTFNPYPKAQQQPQNHHHHHHAGAPAAPQFHQFPTAPSSGGAAPASAGNASAGNGFVTHTQLSSPPFMDMNTPTQSPGNMNATPNSTVSGLSHPPPTQRRHVSAAEKPEVQREISTFMPPPPPPRIATMVFEEETSIKNPSGIYYHLVMRWYSKVQESQQYFVTAEELCPSPNKDLYSFEQWADEVSGWWYTHFEHMQKKAPRFARRR